eukprot:g4531.t1
MSYAVESDSQLDYHIQRASNHFAIFDVSNVLACHDFHYLDLDPEFVRRSCRSYFNITEDDLNPTTGTLVDREGTWQHLAVTWSQENRGETIIYIDGVIVGRAVTGRDNPIQAGGVLMLGGEQDCYDGCTDPGQSFYGLMDEVRIWKVVRTQSEILRYMRSTGEELQNHQDLIAYWKFDDPGTQQHREYGILTDSSGRGNDLDILIPPQKSEAVIQKHGHSLRTHALSFKNNYAMNNEVVGMPEKDITVEFWARGGRFYRGFLNHERSEDFFSFASFKNTTNDHNAWGQASFLFIDDAIRIRRHLTTHTKTEYYGSTTNILGAVSVHINSHRQLASRINENWITFGTSWTDEDWHHIAVSWRFESGETTLFFDGRQVHPLRKVAQGSFIEQHTSRRRISSNLAAGIERSSNGSLVLGQNQECYGGCFSPSTSFNGSLANVRVWNRVLTNAEIRKNMFLDDPYSKEGLIMNFEFGREDFMGTTERDLRVYDKTGAYSLHLGSDGPGFQFSTAPLAKANGDPIEGPRPGYNGYALELNDRQLLMYRDFHDFPTNAITVEFWMWSIDTCRRGTPFSYALGPYAKLDNQFLIFNYNNWGIAVFNDEGGIRDHDAGFGSTDGKWHHIAVTWQSETGQAFLYDNGRLMWEVHRAKGREISDNGTLVIGREQDCLGGCFDSTPGALGDIQQGTFLEYGSQDFVGIIEGVRIWKTVRTHEQIVAGMQYDVDVGSGVMNDFINRNDENLFAWWKFDEGKGYLVKDETGNSHTLSIPSEAKWVVSKWVETY